LDLARADVEHGMTTAIVVADGAFDDVWLLYQGLDPEIGDGRSGDFGRSLTLVPASLVKGLEFDSVVVLHPTELSRATPDGLRLLYVAMTRCTQVLRLVDDDELPTGLEHLVPERVADPVIEEQVLPLEEPSITPDVPTPDPLAELIALLDDDDRQLVTGLVRRLLQGGPRDTLF
jgi:hypothetical protein